MSDSPAILHWGQRAQGTSTGAEHLTVKKSWREFTKNLAACIGALDEDECHSIARADANQYVQFAGMGVCGIRSEATGNGFIEPPELLLDERQYARMRGFGWMRPTALPGEPTDGGSPNFHVDGANSEKGRREYEACHCEGASIRFPTLLIKRRVWSEDEGQCIVAAAWRVACGVRAPHGNPPTLSGRQKWSYAGARVFWSRRIMGWV